MKYNKLFGSIIIVLFIGFFIQTIYILHLQKKIRDIKDFHNSNTLTPKNRFFSLRGMPDFGFYDNFGSFIDSNGRVFREIERMRKRIERMFRESLAVTPLSKNWDFLTDKYFFNPDIDIQEKKDSYVIKMDLPGMDKSKINIEVKGDNLVVSGERKEEVEENTKAGKTLFYKKERSFGYFSRVIPLPFDAQKDKITATYNRGVLRIVVPKNPNKKSIGSERINIL